MSRKDRGLRRTTPDNPVDHGDESSRRSSNDDALSTSVYLQTVSYDADDEKSSGSSLTAPHPMLRPPPPRKKNAAKRKKVAKPSAVAVEDNVDRRLTANDDSSATSSMVPVAVPDKKAEQQ